MEFVGTLSPVGSVGTTANTSSLPSDGVAPGLDLQTVASFNAAMSRGQEDRRNVSGQSLLAVVSRQGQSLDATVEIAHADEAVGNTPQEVPRGEASGQQQTSTPVVTVCDDENESAVRLETESVDVQSVTVCDDENESAVLLETESVPVQSVNADVPKTEHHNEIELLKNVEVTSGNTQSCSRDERHVNNLVTFKETTMQADFSVEALRTEVSGNIEKAPNPQDAVIEVADSVFLANQAPSILPFDVPKAGNENGTIVQDSAAVATTNTPQTSDASEIAEVIPNASSVAIASPIQPSMEPSEVSGSAGGGQNAPFVVNTSPNLPSAMPLDVPEAETVVLNAPIVANTSLIQPSMEPSEVPDCAAVDQNTPSAATSSTVQSPVVPSDAVESQAEKQGLTQGTVVESVVVKSTVAYPMLSEVSSTNVSMDAVVATNMTPPGATLPERQNALEREVAVIPNQMAQSTVPLSESHVKVATAEHTILAMSSEETPTVVSEKTTTETVLTKVQVPIENQSVIVADETTTVTALQHETQVTQSTPQVISDEEPTLVENEFVQNPMRLSDATSVAILDKPSSTVTLVTPREGVVESAVVESPLVVTQVFNDTTNTTVVGENISLTQAIEPGQSKPQFVIGTVPMTGSTENAQSAVPSSAMPSEVAELAGTFSAVVPEVASYGVATENVVVESLSPVMQLVDDKESTAVVESPLPTQPIQPGQPEVLEKPLAVPTETTLPSSGTASVDGAAYGTVGVADPQVASPMQGKTVSDVTADGVDVRAMDAHAAAQEIEESTEYTVNAETAARQQVVSIEEPAETVAGKEPEPLTGDKGVKAMRRMDSGKRLEEDGVLASDVVTASGMSVVVPTASEVTVPDVSSTAIDSVSSTEAKSRVQKVLDVNEVFLQASTAVAETILVSPALLRTREGNIDIQLKQDVLDGSHLSISVVGATMTVTFIPNTPDIAVFLERSIPQLEQHLAMHIGSYQVSVKVKRQLS